MNWLFALSIASVTSFVATNLDDIIVLMLFFSRANASFRPRQIVFGQYLGFTLILLASSIGIIFGLFISKKWIGLLGFVPLAIGVKQLLDPSEDEVQEVSIDLTPAESRSRWRSFFSRIPPRTYHVAAVTVANGGDNIGIYVSLFANNRPIDVSIIVGIFYIMLGIWCALAYFLITHPKIAKLLAEYGHKIIPWVYIFLGIYILFESESYRILFPA
ncbi:cadmium resistance transporter [Pannus brasiliensis CCIBt3594]|uniref:Cadmium resistance transporter n=1 Tax=Pannus brasiliensis CCIBt3594 TaxID=1427578 RepID=A0AAW9QI65_9CHRO